MKKSAILGVARVARPVRAVGMSENLRVYSNSKLDLFKTFLKKKPKGAFTNYVYKTR